MRGGDDDAAIAEWMNLAVVETDSQRRSDFGALALIFAELANRLEPWKQALKGWNVQESQQVLEWQREAREEGREEGRLQTTRRDVRQALETRFRVPLSDDLRRRIEGESDLPTLERWFDAALTAESLDEFRGLM